MIGPRTYYLKNIIDKFINVAKQGRKELLGLFLVTQDPHDIDADILSQIKTKVILNLSEESAIRCLNLPARLKWKVPNLTRGNMVIHSQRRLKRRLLMEWNKFVRANLSLPRRWWLTHHVLRCLPPRPITGLSMMANGYDIMCGQGILCFCLLVRMMVQTLLL